MFFDVRDELGARPPPPLGCGRRRSDAAAPPRGDRVGRTFGETSSRVTVWRASRADGPHPGAVRREARQTCGDTRTPTTGADPSGNAPGQAGRPGGRCREDGRVREGVATDVGRSFGSGTTPPGAGRGTGRRALPSVVRIPDARSQVGEDAASAAGQTTVLDMAGDGDVVQHARCGDAAPRSLPRARRPRRPPSPAAAWCSRRGSAAGPARRETDRARGRARVPPRRGVVQGGPVGLQVGKPRRASGDRGPETAAGRNGFPSGTRPRSRVGRASGNGRGARAHGDVGTASREGNALKGRHRWGGMAVGAGTRRRRAETR